MDYIASENRYTNLAARRCGQSGLQLPEVSLGLWHNFGHGVTSDSIRQMVLGAFDRGIFHFDLANNYGPPPGSAEINFGRVLNTDLRPHRDELIISTKAGYRMWPGPFGEFGSRKYLLASLDQSLCRMGLDYVDIFYSHRFDPNTPLEETMTALDTAVRQGKALYVGISSYSARKTREASKILTDLGTPCVIHQPSYSMLNRWVERDLLNVLSEEGIGCIAFSPLAQGMLSSKYLNGIPEASRAARNDTALSRDLVTQDRIDRVVGLNTIARDRNQSLAQMALAWVLRRPEITSVLIGASSLDQIIENIAATENTHFSDEELKRIDQYAVDSDINLWAESSRE